MDLQFIPEVDTQEEYKSFRTESIGTRHIIKMYDEFFDPTAYLELVDIIQKANKGDEIIFDIASGGGDFEGFLVLHSALMNTKAKTIARVTSACSAATMLMLSCDVVIMEPLSYIMIHAYSSGSVGKKQELKAKAEFDNKYFLDVMNTLYSPFLTEDELDKVDSGSDIWMTKDEVQDRLKTWVPIRKRGK